MVFSSPEFLFLFLPIVLLLFTGAQLYWPWATKPMLVLASLVFYGWFEWAFVPLILGSCLFNYCTGRMLAKASCGCHGARAKGLLVIGILFNILLLAWFKYAGFLANAINMATDWGIPVPNLILPIAISFFTFQQIAYLVDAYQGKTKQEGFVNYSLFVVFFPQLIAGPIVHHSQMGPQYKHLPSAGLATSVQVSSGLALLTLGLFKKVVIADTIASWIYPAFARVDDLSLIDAWTAAFGYALQIYFDFSGYCEMAMGLALLFGIRLPVNFNSPYQASNVSEFWRRWHITLGQFLKEYLYIPLGGSRSGVLRMCLALMITMLLGGLWHGAGWQFVLWGALHGLFLVTYQAWKRTGLALPKPMAIAVTLLAIIVAWVPFRAQSIDETLLVWSAMFSPSLYEHLPIVAAILSDLTGDTYTGVKTVFAGWELAVFVFLMVFCASQPSVHQYLKGFKPRLKPLFGISAAACVALAMMGQPSSFIYFAF